MRLLHTSDWHLGRSLHGEDLLAAQEVFADWLVDTAVAEGVDAVLVAGDVFDRAVPPVDAVRLADDLLARLAGVHVPVVLIPGNHDSATRLGFGGRVAAAGGVHLRSRVADLDRPVLLADASGPVAVYGVPYLDPDATRAELAADRSHASVTAAAMARVRADAAARGIARSVVLAHAAVAGGEASDSERDIRVGGVSGVAPGAWAGASYVALGHLHGAQRVSGAMRYSGSPLPFSFSEAAHTKSVTLVELGPTGAVTTSLLPTPVPRGMARLEGTLEELLGDPAHASHEASWVHAVLTDQRRPEAPMERLRSRFPHALVLEFRPLGARPEVLADLDRLRRTSDPVEVTGLFVEYVSGAPATEAERGVVAAAYARVREAAVSA